MQTKYIWLSIGTLSVSVLIAVVSVRSMGISDMASSRPIYKTEDGSEVIRERYAAILNDYPVTFTSHNIPTSQGETFVIESGVADSPVVVLLHGSMSNSLMWMNEVSRWNNDFHIYSIDIIGEPGLSAASRPEFNSSKYAEWIDEVLNQLNINHASFVGTSLGGWFALDYTIRRPENVSKLVLVSPGGVGKQKSILWWVIPLSLMGDWGRNIVRELMVGNQTNRGSALATKLADLLAIIPQHFNPRLEKLPIFSDEQLAGIDVPVMAVVGGKDMMLDAEAIRERLDASVANFKLDYLPEARHFPGDRSEQIREFLLDNSIKD